MIRKSRKFEDTFGKLGKEWELTDELFSHLEEFICTLYGYKEKNVNKVRWLKFRDKHTKQKKVIDTSALPPCKETLKLRNVQANYVAKYGYRLCKATLMLPISVVMVGIQRVRQNGFITHSQTIWKIFFDPLFDEDDFKSGSECDESDDDC